MSQPTESTTSASPDKAESSATASQAAPKPKTGTPRRRKAKSPAEPPKQPIATSVVSLSIDDLLAQIDLRLDAGLKRHAERFVGQFQQHQAPPTPLIFSAINKIMHDVVPLAKLHENDEAKFFFRRIDEVCAQLQPLFVQHNVFVMPTALKEKEAERPVVLSTDETFVQIFTKVLVRYRFYCTIDGSYIDAVLWGEGMSEQHFSTAAAITMAFKQILTETFCIPVYGAADPEEAAGERSQASAPKQFFVSPEAVKTTASAPAATPTTPSLFPDAVLPTNGGGKKGKGKRGKQEPQVASVGGASIEGALDNTVVVEEKDTPLSGGFLKILETNMKSKGVSAETVIAKFEVATLAEIGTSRMNEALAFVNAFVNAPKAAEETK